MRPATEDVLTASPLITRVDQNRRPLATPDDTLTLCSECFKMRLPLQLTDTLLCHRRMSLIQHLPAIGPTGPPCWGDDSLFALLNPKEVSKIFTPCWNVITSDTCGHQRLVLPQWIDQGHQEVTLFAPPHPAWWYGWPLALPQTYLLHYPNHTSKVMRKTIGRKENPLDQSWRDRSSSRPPALLSCNVFKPTFNRFFFRCHQQSIPEWSRHETWQRLYHICPTKKFRVQINDIQCLCLFSIWIMHECFRQWSSW